MSMNARSLSGALAAVLVGTASFGAQAEIAKTPAPALVAASAASNDVDYATMVAKAYGDTTYIVLDKKDAQIYLFNNGKMVLSAPALTGASTEDQIYADTYYKPLKDITAKDSVTPAGRYTLSYSPANPKNNLGQTLDINQVYGLDWKISIHGVWLGNPAEHRAERLASHDADQSHISHMCINVSKATLNNILAVVGHTQATPIYILPENRSMTQSYIYAPAASYVAPVAIANPALAGKQSMDFVTPTTRTAKPNSSQIAAEIAAEPLNVAVSELQSYAKVIRAAASHNDLSNIDRVATLNFRDNLYSAYASRKDATDLDGDAAWVLNHAQQIDPKLTYDFTDLNTDATVTAPKAAPAVAPVTMPANPTSNIVVDWSKVKIGAPMTANSPIVIDWAKVKTAPQTTATTIAKPSAPVASPVIAYDTTGFNNAPLTTSHTAPTAVAQTPKTTPGNFKNLFVAMGTNAPVKQTVANSFGPYETPAPIPAPAAVVAVPVATPAPKKLVAAPIVTNEADDNTTEDTNANAQQIALVNLADKEAKIAGTFAAKAKQDADTAQKFASQAVNEANIAQMAAAHDRAVAADMQNVTIQREEAGLVLFPILAFAALAGAAALISNRRRNTPSSNVEVTNNEDGSQTTKYERNQPPVGEETTVASETAMDPSAADLHPEAIAALKNPIIAATAGGTHGFAAMPHFMKEWFAKNKPALDLADFPEVKDDNHAATGVMGVAGLAVIGLAASHHAVSSASHMGLMSVGAFGAFLSVALNPFAAKQWTAPVFHEERFVPYGHINRFKNSSQPEIFVARDYGKYRGLSFQAQGELERMLNANPSKNIAALANDMWGKIIKADWKAAATEMGVSMAVGAVVKVTLGTAAVALVGAPFGAAIALGAVSAVGARLVTNALRNRNRAEEDKITMTAKDFVKSAAIGALFGGIGYGIMNHFSHTAAAAPTHQAPVHHNAPAAASAPAQPHVTNVAGHQFADSALPQNFAQMTTHQQMQSLTEAGTKLAHTGNFEAAKNFFGAAHEVGVNKGISATSYWAQRSAKDLAFVTSKLASLKAG